ncbi:hypothetical protein [Streptomyces bluensis]|uniref:Uncharacterized protein n=1 Tax=Streptomyces bluensis TaxID=33897 RepID=A0ABW6UW61_9ACTN
MHNHDEFDDIVNTETWGPYGPSAAEPVKPGLTKRGKAALTIGAAVLAGGGILTWQHYSAEAEANQVRSQELALQQQQLELEKLKEMNKAAAENAKTQATYDAARQKQIDACIDANKSLVGKQMGVTYSSVVDDCQNQYAGTSTTPGMQEAAASSDTGTDSGGGISPGLLLGIGTGGALLIGFAANRGKKTNAA